MISGMCVYVCVCVSEARQLNRWTDQSITLCQGVHDQQVKWWADRQVDCDQSDQVRWSSKQEREAERKREEQSDSLRTH